MPSSINIIIRWSDSGTIRETIIDMYKFPVDDDHQNIKKMYSVFLNYINTNLYTAQQCLDFMNTNSIGPFINNYIDRIYNIDSIDIILNNVTHNFNMDKKNENFVITFNKYFEIIKDYNTFSWRFTQV